MTEQIKPSDLWDAIELVGKRWQDSLKADCPLIPLRDLRPLWNNAVGTGLDPRDRLRLETQGHENLLLKAENQRLRRQLQLVMGSAHLPAIERRRIERRRAS